MMLSVLNNPARCDLKGNHSELYGNSKILEKWTLVFTLWLITGSKEFIGVVLVTDSKCYDKEGKDLHNFLFCVLLFMLGDLLK